ncbi:HNH endonuclease [Aureimonas altamirensis]|uniref:HNH endonuclease n=1 Tax=Aureimonas altamirensis TaxID=370622 RepID=UPI002036AD8C|nr:HNH endonuclease [Aureimonas altamirensis]MCM2503901.1 HNH endonuclease [Aureimonas altamirensis]
MLTQERLFQELFYDELSGEFWWNKPAPRRDISKPAGHYDDRGYVRITIDGTKHYGHRLAVLYMTGSMPAEHVDHINHDKGDNSWTNLRLATPAQNQWNQGSKATNTSGYKGVRAKGNRYDARIRVNGKRYELGRYDTAEEAAAAYEAAASKYHGEYAKVL